MWGFFKSPIIRLSRTNGLFSDISDNLAKTTNESLLFLEPCSKSAVHKFPALQQLLLQQLLLERKCSVRVSTITVIN